MFSFSNIIIMEIISSWYPWIPSFTSNYNCSNTLRIRSI